MKVMEKTHIKKENKVGLTIDVVDAFLDIEVAPVAFQVLVTLLMLLRLR